MGYKFLFVRSLKVLLEVAVLLLLVELIEKHSIVASFTFTWSFITTAILMKTR